MNINAKTDYYTKSSSMAHVPPAQAALVNFHTARPAEHADARPSPPQQPTPDAYLQLLVCGLSASRIDYLLSQRKFRLAWSTEAS